MYSFSYLEPVCCSMSNSNCCFLTCIQVSQEAGQVVWYSHLFQNFPQFIVIHTVKDFGIVNKAEMYGFCHTFTRISHGCTCVSHPEPLSHLPPHHIPQGHPSALALSTLSHASNLGWRSVSHMIIYMFQCYSLRSSHPRLLLQGPEDCSIHLCLF